MARCGKTVPSRGSCGSKELWFVAESARFEGCNTLSVFQKGRVGAARPTSRCLSCFLCKTSDGKLNDVDSRRGCAGLPRVIDVPLQEATIAHQWGSPDECVLFCENHEAARRPFDGPRGGSAAAQVLKRGHLMCAVAVISDAFQKISEVHAWCEFRADQ